MDAAPELTGYQAERIARTETAMAFVEGNRQVWETEGVQMKQWLVGGGQCELCSEILADYPDPVPIGQMYVADDWAEQGPPRHPNCRCDIAPIVEFTDDE
jgi:hypothetical protein